MNEDRFYPAITLCDLCYRDHQCDRRVLPAGTKIRVEETYFGPRMDLIGVSVEHDFRLKISLKVIREVSEG